MNSDTAARTKQPFFATADKCRQKGESGSELFRSTANNMTNTSQILNNTNANFQALHASDGGALLTVAPATTPASAQLSSYGDLSRLAQFGVELQSRLDAEMHGSNARATSNALDLQATSAARAVNAQLFDAPLTTPPVKKKKRGFFSKLGGAIKKFARSKFGKILMIGGAVAASFLIPGAGAALTKAFSALGKSLLGGASKLAAKFGASNLFKGGFKLFLKQQLLPKLGLEGGIKQAAQNYLKEKLLNTDSLKDLGHSLLKKFGLEDLLSKSGIKAVLSQLGARLGVSNEWLERLFGESHAAVSSK